MDEELQSPLAGESLTFLYQSIADLQSTIRAIDAKLGILIVILSLPFSTIGVIYSRFSEIPAALSGLKMYIAYFLFSVFAGLWLMAFGTAMRGLIGIDNPAIHIPENRANGAFYCPGLFDHRFSDVLLNRSGLQSTRSVASQLSLLPTTEGRLLEELTFEQMKLAYIRDMKQLRHRWAFRLAFFWLLLGLGVYVLV